MKDKNGSWSENNHQKIGTIINERKCNSFRLQF